MNSRHSMPMKIHTMNCCCHPWRPCLPGRRCCTAGTLQESISENCPRPRSCTVLLRQLVLVETQSFWSFLGIPKLVCDLAVQKWSYLNGTNEARYLKQPYKDNYVDSSFLDSLILNANVQRYEPGAYFCRRSFYIGWFRVGNSIAFCL